MTSAVIGALVRQLLTLVGAAGFIEGDDLQKLISAISVIVSIVWSIIEKKKNPRN